MKWREQFLAYLAGNAERIRMWSAFKLVLSSNRGSKRYELGYRRNLKEDGTTIEELPKIKSFWEFETK